MPEGGDDGVAPIRVLLGNPPCRFVQEWVFRNKQRLNVCSNEVVVGTPDRCYKVNYIKRLPERQQKNAELFKSVLGVPWRLRPNVARNHEDADLEAGDIPTMVATAPIVPEDELPPRVEAHGREQETVPRRLYTSDGTWSS